MKEYVVKLTPDFVKKWVSIEKDGKLTGMQAFDMLPPYIKTRINQKGEATVVYFPEEKAYGDIID